MDTHNGHVVVVYFGPGPIVSLLVGQFRLNVVVLNVSGRCKDRVIKGMFSAVSAFRFDPQCGEFQRDVLLHLGLACHTKLEFLRLFTVEH